MWADGGYISARTTSRDMALNQEVNKKLPLSFHSLALLAGGLVD